MLIVLREFDSEDPPFVERLINALLSIPSDKQGEITYDSRIRFGRG